MCEQSEKRRHLDLTSLEAQKFREPPDDNYWPQTEHWMLPRTSCSLWSMTAESYHRRYALPTALFDNCVDSPRNGWVGSIKRAMSLYVRLWTSEQTAFSRPAAVPIMLPSSALKVTINARRSDACQICLIGSLKLESHLIAAND